MKTLSEKLKKKCEGLSRKNKRKLLVGLSVCYVLCAIWTLLQGLQGQESGEIEQVQKLGLQSVQIEHLVLKTNKKYTNNERNNNTKNNTQTATD